MPVDRGGATVGDLFEAAAAANPHATAAVAGEQSMTYTELDAEANRLAHHLQASGVGPDVRVAVCLERSLDLAVSLLAVLKAGGACVPMDPAYPPARLASMVTDSDAAVVITSASLAGSMPGGGTTVIRVEADRARWADRPTAGPRRSTGAENLAHVIYTSGSTGQPRGVMLTHRGMVNHHRAVVDLYGLHPGDRVLQLCSLGFDASIEEMFPTWAAGATVVFRPDDAPLLGRAWLEWLRDRRITVVNLPTAYWTLWTADIDALGERVPDDLRLAVVGGEKALGPTYRDWRRVTGARCRWINVYGPTETTCMSTFYEPGPDDDDIGEGRDPPIGRPLPNTTVLVVDDALRPLPEGVTGELLIGGSGLARGYLHDPGRTAERFVDVSAGDSPAVRMYRTGDLVRQRRNGDLDYVGRIDHQVKIRGFRVECGEVEAALARHPAVASSVVMARDEARGGKQLVAYVVGTEGVAVKAGDLRRFLAERLPTHMVPAAFTVLDALPLTPGGKVDRAALPTPVPSGLDHRDAGARSPAEDRVAAIWSRVLGREVADLDPADDFFELGGHSLLATQVIAQLREEFGTDTPLRAIFEAPTIAGLAALAVEAEATSSTRLPLRTAEHRRPGDKVPLSLAQEQLWRLEMAAQPPGLYNFTALHRFDSAVDEDALRGALACLVDRHEILRTGFAAGAEGPYQFAVPPVPAVDVPLAVTDLSDEPAASRDEALRRRIAEEDAKPFDLARPPLFRAGLFHLDERCARLAVTFDHLVCDGTGVSIFMEELVAAYDAVAAHRAPSLPSLDVQFADFAAWQRSSLTEAELRRQLDWWLEALRGMRLGPAVPFDHVPTAPTRRIASTGVSVSAGTRAGLEELGRATESTLFTVAAAAVSVLFGQCGGTADVVMSTTLSGRNRAELERVIGTFAGIGRIRADLAGDPPFAAVVARVRDFVLGMFENQDVPFMRVRRALFPDFPSGPLAVATALPGEFQFFHTGKEPELFFRGQLHPLSVTLSDDGARLSGELSCKLDFYRPETIERLARDLEGLLDAVAADPSLPLSALPIRSRRSR